ncbi:MAG: CBS domain-containing protein [Candidatus Latescibacterota bacterium]|jgi:CBS domain-containing protein
MKLTAREIMTAPAICALDTMTVAELVELLRQRQISGVPVVDAQGRLSGVVSITDLIALDADLPEESGVGESDFHTSPAMDGLSASGGLLEPDAAVSEFPIASFMSRRVITATEDTPLGELAGQLVAHRIHRLIIVRQDQVTGIVTVRDILRALQVHYSGSSGATAALPEDTAHAPEGR